ncbi:hypothetical protein CHLRE_06g279050v5 [Chlamydomonas reinhardtii]|uniref:Protein kinase domain-containing protein n=1 Tax=Chlamydomonas reinhardtii TaxID=3055 RepID=A0A2K3DPJ8_CHLRE|nr:uncharacterized protein CHLRE_06g279050v5 [Chlamydomonas reinhardtii]PNW82440.1 hypothetical protein CHLRE_06g279050v5 [Chlamydomonas reinhardtii]
MVQAGSHAAAAEIVCCEVTTRHSSGAARVGAAATEPTAACSPARAAASSSADPMSPAAVRFISDRAVAAGAAPFTAPARLTSTPPPPVSGAELAAGLQAAFPILGAASLATGAGAVKVLVGGRVVHRAGWVAGVSTGLRQREVQHVPSAFVAERHRPLVALARKSVTVRFPPAELRAALSDPSPEWFADMLRPCVREAVVCGEVMRRFRSRHGQAALERWFPEQFGWTVEVVSEKEAGVSGCFRFVTHSAWQANGNLESYMTNLFADRDPERYAKTVKALTQWAHVCELLSAAGITHGDMKPGNLLVDEDGNIKLTDLDGAALLPAHIVMDAQEDAEMATAAGSGGAAAAVASAAMRGLETAAVSESPYTMTTAFAPPEMWVGWARSRMSYPDSLEQLLARAESRSWAGALQLLQQLDGCETRLEQLQLLSDLGGRDWMCAASHTYLLGAAVCDWSCEQLGQLACVVGGGGRALQSDVGFLSELHDVAEGLMALRPCQRPSMQQLRTRLARLADDWC